MNPELIATVEPIRDDITKRFKGYLKPPSETECINREYADEEFGPLVGKAAVFADQMVTSRRRSSPSTMLVSAGTIGDIVDGVATLLQVDEDVIEIYKPFEATTAAFDVIVDPDDLENVGAVNLDGID